MVPAGSIHRLTLEYKLGLVNMTNSFHMTNSSPLDYPEWWDDLTAIAPLFVGRLRTIMSNTVEFIGARVHILDQPQQLPFAMTTSTLGLLAQVSLPALTYARFEIRSRFKSEKNRYRKNFFLLSGIGRGLADDNCLRADAMLDFRTSWVAMMGTMYSGHSSWQWRIAYRPNIPGPYSVLGVDGIDGRGSFRVLGSRVR